MNADEPERVVLWTTPAKADLKVLIDKRGFSRSDFQRLAAGLRLVAVCKCAEDHPFVAPLRFCEKYTSGMFRFKHTGLTVSIRVIFELTDTALTVWACLERTDSTYRLAEDRVLELVRGILK